MESVYFFFCDFCACCCAAACCCIAACRLRWNRVHSSSNIFFFSSTLFLSSTCCCFNRSNLLWSWNEMSILLTQSFTIHYRSSSGKSVVCVDRIKRNKELGSGKLYHLLTFHANFWSTGSIFFFFLHKLGSWSYEIAQLLSTLTLSRFLSDTEEK